MTRELPARVPPADISAAFGYARGARQRLWVRSMLSAEGLHPSAGQQDRYAPMTNGAVQRFVERLALAGFRVRLLPLGPRGGRRYVIAEFRPELAPVIQACASRPWAALGMYRPHEVWEWAAVARPDQRDVFSALAPDFTGSLDELTLLAAASEVER